MCEIVTRAGADFIKTSTGFSKAGATLSLIHIYARLYLEENCENVETTKVENIAGGADCERVLREFINDGCEIIVGTSFDYLDYMLALADEYPDVTFINGSGYETKDNLSVYIAKLEQGRYLTGILAGKMTEVNKIGYC